MHTIKCKTNNMSRFQTSRRYCHSHGVPTLGKKAITGVPAFHGPVLSDLVSVGVLVSAMSKIFERWRNKIPKEFPNFSIEIWFRLLHYFVWQFWRMLQVCSQVSHSWNRWFSWFLALLQKACRIIVLHCLLNLGLWFSTWRFQSTCLFLTVFHFLCVCCRWQHVQYNGWQIS